MPADTSPPYHPHRRDAGYGVDCRCGAKSGIVRRDGESWGDHCPVAMREEIARLKAELAEALATLANERGEGEPPVEGWATKRNPMLNDIPDNWWWERHLVMVFRRRDSGWDRNEYVPDRGVVVTSHPTARAAMIAASAAKGGAR